MRPEKASCSCGKLVLFYDDEISGKLRTSICHCYACRKRTGSAFGTQIRLDKLKVTIEGKGTKFDRPTDEGDHVHFFFCPSCGTTLYWEIDDLPDSISVPIGAFENHNLPSPTFSVYEDQMLSWVVLPTSITEHMG
ncbi:MAG: GFA family protein [Candidatus Ozemobacteraceae bacterium]